MSRASSVEAAALCRAAVVLKEGEIEEAGPLAGLPQAPRSELLRAFKEQLQRPGGLH
jgi:ABC-type methionine transport system ATPase subunit